MLLVHVFVYFACVNFCPFSLPLGFRGWLRLVTVALPGLFYYFFLRFFAVGCSTSKTTIILDVMKM